MEQSGRCIGIHFLHPSNDALVEIEASTPVSTMQRQNLKRMSLPINEVEGFERTLVLLKPNAVPKSKAIRSLLRRAGLHVLKRRRMFLQQDQAKDFFLQSLDDQVNKYYHIYQSIVAEESRGKRASTVKDVRVDDAETRTAENSTLEDFVDFMTSGPVEAMIVVGRGAVSKTLFLLGPEDPSVARAKRPESIRARFGGDSVAKNAAYASDSDLQAEKEICFFFPELNSGADSKQQAASGEYLSKNVNPVLLKGLIQLCRQKPDNPLVWLADWLLANNPNDRP